MASAAGIRGWQKSVLSRSVGHLRNAAIGFVQRLMPVDDMKVEMEHAIMGTGVTVHAVFTIPRAWSKLGTAVY